MASLSLENVTKSFGNTEVIKGVDIAVDEGEFVVFVGPSGCGKSTLLRIIAGLEDATGGRIVIGDRVVNHASPKERGIAMVFQNYALYPHKTVYENMAFNLKIDGLSRRQIAEKVTETARVLHMEELLHRRPSQLSGGQRQRVAIGRAIVREPKLFLFDEPLSNLDADLRGKMRSEIAKLHAQLPSTMIYVTHDQVEAMTLADRIVVLDSGVVQQVGTPMELYHHPKNVFVAGFIGAPRMNFFDVEIRRSGLDATDVFANDIGTISVPVALRGAQAGEKAVLGIRPEYLDHTITGQSSTDEHLLKGRVQVVERLGHKAGIELQSASGASFTAIVDGDNPVKVGDTVAVGFGVHRCHLFDANGLAGHRAGDAPLETAETVLDGAY